MTDSEVKQALALGLKQGNEYRSLCHYLGLADHLPDGSVAPWTDVVIEAQRAGRAAALLDISIELGKLAKSVRKGG